MIRWGLVTYIFFLLICSPVWAQSPDFSASKARAKPYSKKWNAWFKDGRTKDQVMQAIAKDFEVLAGQDFAAACAAMLGIKSSSLSNKELIRLGESLRFGMFSGLKKHSSFIVKEDRYKKSWNKKNRAKRPPVYPRSLPRPGQPWPALSSRTAGQPGDPKQTLARADISLKRLKASKAQLRKDYKEAFRLYSELAQRGDPSSQYSLARMYFDGRGVSPSFKKAFEWCSLASKQGYPRAQNLLGTMYNQGLGVTRSEAQATALFQAAAKKGLAEAQHHLGMQYDKGLGVPQSYEKAVYWYRKSAEQGDAKAQFDLSLKYQKGQGVQKSYTEAAKLLRKSAANGNAYAKFNLGLLCETGIGVPKDRNQAIVWFRGAADQGLGLAKEKLKKMGVPYP